MAQSSYLLILAGLVVSMLAAAMGVAMFLDHRRVAQADAAILDLHQIAQDIRVWKETPELKGGGMTKALGDVTFLDLYKEDAPCDAVAAGVPASVRCYAPSAELRYAMTTTPDSVVLVAVSRPLGFEPHDFRIAEAVVTGGRAEVWRAWAVP